MKTKNVLIAAVILISSVLSVSGVFAQTPTNSDQVTLNIKLNPIQTITVNSDQKEVNIVYSSIDDYKNGVSVTQDDHIQVFSTGGFQVKVNSAATLTNDKGTGINATDITVLATKGIDNGGENTIENAVALGSEQTLIASETGGRDLKYNVTYNNILGGNDKYLNLYDKDANNVFTTEVTYTIIAN